MKISDAAKTYQKLLDYNYSLNVVRNRNSNIVSLTFNFEKYQFYHLCGLHKLTDIRNLDVKSIRDKEKIFDKIINGEYLDYMFECSAYYDKITDRIDCLEKLDFIMDNSLLIFKRNSLKRDYSEIKFDYLVKLVDESKNQYYLTVEDEEQKGIYCGCSCFGRPPQKDYAKGHTSYSVLQKTKINLITHEETELYIAPSYKKQLEAESTATAQDVPAKDTSTNPITSEVPKRSAPFSRAKQKKVAQKIRESERQNPSKEREIHKNEISR